MSRRQLAAGLRRGKCSALGSGVVRDGRVFFVGLTEEAGMVYIENMTQTRTITIANATVMQLLKQLAALKLIGFVEEEEPQVQTIAEETISPITAKLNAVYAHIDSSVPDDIMAAQMEVMNDEDW
jgi:hypothetical protein